MRKSPVFYYTYLEKRELFTWNLLTLVNTILNVKFKKIQESFIIILFWSLLVLFSAFPLSTCTYWSLFIGYREQCNYMKGIFCRYQILVSQKTYFSKFGRCKLAQLVGLFCRRVYWRYGVWERALNFHICFRCSPTLFKLLINLRYFSKIWEFYFSVCRLRRIHWSAPK